MKRPTVGKISGDLAKKSPDSRDPIELEREMQKEYLIQLYEAIDAHKKISKNDCFVVVLTKRERLMDNVFRNYFFSRKTCPTPDYDQTVFKYHAHEDGIEYLWTIPSKDTCIHLKNNALLVAPQERHLLDFILKFADGTLYRMCKRLNGEAADSNLIVN